MRLQIQLSNAKWDDLDDDKIVESILDRIIERESWFAEREKRAPMTTHEQVIQYLSQTDERGRQRELRFGDDWYNSVRDGDLHDQIVAAREAAREANRRMVKCSCGHTVEASLVMHASLGTSCPDCYDDMSD